MYVCTCVSAYEIEYIIRFLCTLEAGPTYQALRKLNNMYTIKKVILSHTLNCKHEIFPTSNNQITCKTIKIIDPVDALEEKKT